MNYTALWVNFSLVPSSARVVSLEALFPHCKKEKTNH
jgi:hypothetical protein